jgi:hypothetical protein
MITNCPNCNKPMSSLAPLCPNCGFASGEVSEDDLQEFQRRKLRDRLYRLKMTSYAVISAFLAAFGWYWWDTAGFVQASGPGPVIAIGVATVVYLAIRAFLFQASREMKKLRSAS